MGLRALGCAIAEVGEQATQGIEELTALLKDIRGGRGTVGRLFTDEGLYRDMHALVQSADRVAAQISRGQGTLGRLSNDPRLYNELTDSVRICAP
jgi:phospholipid/cholesterol/gamma-HCH transport system substrate-binding protein